MEADIEELLCAAMPHMRMEGGTYEIGFPIGWYPELNSEPNWDHVSHTGTTTTTTKKTKPPTFRQLHFTIKDTTPFKHQWTVTADPDRPTAKATIIKHGESEPCYKVGNVNGV